MNRVVTFLFLLLTILLFALLGSACSETQQNSIPQVLGEISAEIDETLQTPEFLEFAGKVTDRDTGKWLNNYTVLLFLKGEEIYRDTSDLGKCDFSGHGVHDGLFHIQVNNKYELTSEHQIFAENGRPLEMAYGSSPYGGIENMHYWFDEMAPGTIKVLRVPSKQIEYTLVILSSVDAPEYLGISAPFSARLTPDYQVVAKSVSENGLNTQVQPTNIAPEAAFYRSNQPKITWNRPLTGITANRWDVWQNYVAYRVPGLTWETFKEEVLLHNPQLVRDGYIFYPNQTYWIPDLPAMTNN